MVQLVKKFLKNKKGEIDVLIVLFIVFLGMSILTTSIEPFILSQKLNSMAELVVEEVEYRGVIDGNTRSYINKLSSSYGLDTKDFSYNFTGNISPSGKIQLREEFNLKMQAKVKLKFANLGEKINIEIPLSKNFLGTSQVYYRPSEFN